MNNSPDDSLLRRLLTISALAGAAMSLVVLILWYSGNLISMWTLCSDIVLWGCIVWGILELKKISGGEMRFGRAFTYGLQISFLASLFVAVTYYIIIRFLHPTFLQDYYEWTEKLMYSLVSPDLPAEDIKELNSRIEAELALTRATTTVMSFTLGKLINYSLFGGLFSLVAAAILRHRKTIPPHTESQENESDK